VETASWPVVDPCGQEGRSAQAFVISRVAVRQGGLVAKGGEGEGVGREESPAVRSPVAGKSRFLPFLATGNWPLATAPVNPEG